MCAICGGITDLVSRYEFEHELRKVKLHNRKIRWVIQMKLHLDTYKLTSTVRKSVPDEKDISPLIV